MLPDWKIRVSLHRQNVDRRIGNPVKVQVAQVGAKNCF